MADDKLTLADILPYLDRNKKDQWSKFSDTEKKSVSFWLLNRYISSVKGSRSEQAAAVQKTNFIYNMNWNVLGTKHPELQWQLMCVACNTKKKEYHEWIGQKKKEGNDTGKIFKFLKELYPLMKIEEVELLAKISTKKEIRELARDMGHDTFPF